MKFTLVILLTLSTTIGLSQNYLTNPGENGIHLSIAKAFPRNTNGTNLEIGLTLKGRFTMSFGSYSEHLKASEIRGKEFYGVINYLLVNQSANRYPFSLNFNAQYLKGEQNNALLTYDTYSFGATFYHSIKLNPSLKVIPGFGTFYNISDVEFDNVNPIENNLSSRINVTILLGNLYIRPNYLISNKNIFSAAIGYYFH